MRKLKPMQVGEFIRKITTGERELPYIKLEEGSDLAGHEGFPTLQNYLRGENLKGNLKKNPINISNSEFRCVKASGIYLPYTIANNTDFDGAHFEGASLPRSSFWEAHFDKAHFEKASLPCSLFFEARFYKAHFEGADLDRGFLNGAHFDKAHFEEASLPGASFYGTNFYKSHFDKAHFEGGHFQAAHFDKAHFEGAYFDGAHFDFDSDGVYFVFDGAHFKGTYFDRGYFYKASLKEANLYGTIFYKSDLRGVRNLDKAKGLESAVFSETRVNQREEAIIRNEFKKNNLELRPGQLIVLD